MPEIDAKDCRLEGMSNASGTVWRRGIYLPFGITVDLSPAIGRGVQGKRRLMEKLQSAVDRYMDNELAKLR